MSWHFITPLSKIPFGYFDMGGVLHHSRYFLLLEELREAYFRSIGQAYVNMVKEGFHLPIVDLHINYKKPIRYDEDIIGYLNVKIISDTRILCLQELQTPDNITYSTATTTHVLVKLTKDGSTFKPTKVLDYLKLPSSIKDAN